MKKILILACSLLTLLILTGCKSKDDLDSLKQFSKLNKTELVRQLYVIPGMGCTGCISDIEQLAMDSVKNKKLYFLFTRIQSVKLLKIRFGNDFINNENVILDSMNLFKYPKEYKEIYPLLIKNIDNKLVVYQSFKP